MNRFILPLSFAILQTFSVADAADNAEAPVAKLLAALMDLNAGRVVQIEATMTAADIGPTCAHGLLAGNDYDLTWQSGNEPSTREIVVGSSAWASEDGGATWVKRDRDPLLQLLLVDPSRVEIAKAPAEIKALGEERIEAETCLHVVLKPAGKASEWQYWLSMGAKGHPINLRRFLGEVVVNCTTFRCEVDYVFAKEGLAVDAPASVENVDELGKQIEDAEQHADQLRDQHKDLEAIPFAERIVELTRRRYGKNSERMVEAIGGLIDLYMKLEQYDKAEPLYWEELRLTRIWRGCEQIDVAGVLGLLGSLYDKKQQYGKAEALYKEALQSAYQSPGENDINVIAGLNILCLFYTRIGDYEKASELCQEALKLPRDALDNSGVGAILLNNLGLANAGAGNYEKAEELYQQGLGTHGSEPGTVYANLGELYLMMGDYQQAETLLLKALPMRRAYGDKDPIMAAILSNLAWLYTVKGNYPEALKRYDEALEVEKKTIGERSTTAAVTLTNQGIVYFFMAEYEKAEERFQQVLQLLEGGPAGRLASAFALDNLAQVYWRRGELAKSEQYCQQAHQILKEMLGDEQAVTVAVMENLVLLDIDLGKQNEATLLASKAAVLRSSLLARILAFAPEEQRLAYRQKTDFFYALAATHRNDEELATAVLRYKGIVLDSVIEDRVLYEANRNAEGQDLLKKLGSDRRQLAQLQLQSGSLPTEETAKRIDALEGEIKQIQTELARNLTSFGKTRRALTVTPSQIASVLKNDTAFVEYFAYHRYAGQARMENGYGAVVICPNSDPVLVVLPDAKTLEPIIKRHVSLMRPDENLDDDQTTQNLTLLYREIWEPVRKVLPAEIKRVIISPDGQLNFVSFASLLGSDQRFLGETLTVEYVSTGRDLLEPVRDTASHECLVFGDPDFDNRALAQTGASALEASQMRGTETRDLKDLHFDRLAGTAEEVKQLRAQAEAWGWQPKLFMGSEATKARLLEIRHPYILHLATHGFFEPVDSEESEFNQTVQLEDSRRKYFDNPMHRSGVALTGANLTFAAWRNKKEVAWGDDGVLTAEDASGLDLHDTWLVTLAACHTGEGEASAGEGVMGLRRGFLEAGARNVLMTLWAVHDLYTAQFMADFYARAHSTNNAPLALAEVQRDWLVKLRSEKGVAAAVRWAGPFILAFKGKP
jgi:CHAT domain-containing protein/Tfp pilus assembly protein PilF